jgi:hypothetical protein
MGTGTAIVARNWTMNKPFLLNQMLKAGQKISGHVELRDYAVGTTA